MIHSFDDHDGSNPYASLIFDAAGNLYGTTEYGGDLTDCYLGCGVVFELSKLNGNWTEKVLRSFYVDSKEPFGSLVFDNAGSLYGTTRNGGAYNEGTVFELIPGANGDWAAKTLRSFNGKDGVGQAGGLLFDIAGNLYGTTPFGGAYDTGGDGLYQLMPSTDGKWTETVLHRFKDGSRGGFFPFWRIDL